VYRRLIVVVALFSGSIHVSNQFSLLSSSLLAPQSYKQNMTIDSVFWMDARERAEINSNSFIFSDFARELAFYAIGTSGPLCCCIIYHGPSIGTSWSSPAAL
jgi:hypothetical protein